MSSNKPMPTQELIILVDPDDQPIGVIEKMRAHEYAMLHQAFSILLFRNNNGITETLLQQRSLEKYHCGGLWTNTCCSHPHPGESIIASAKKRLKIEMGIEAELEEAGTFHYVAVFDNGLIENEIDHVLVGTYDADDIAPNPDEVESYCWIEINALKKDLSLNQKKYTPWLKQALDIALSSVI